MDAVEETPAGVDLVINKPVDLKKSIVLSAKLWKTGTMLIKK